MADELANEAVMEMIQKLEQQGAGKMDIGRLIPHMPSPIDEVTICKHANVSPTFPMHACEPNGILDPQKSETQPIVITLSSVFTKKSPKVNAVVPFFLWIHAQCIFTCTHAI